jgi:hypothetical protein
MNGMRRASVYLIVRRRYYNKIMVTVRLQCDSVTMIMVRLFIPFFVTKIRNRKCGEEYE